MSRSSDRNLLFGIIALQNGFITSDQLVAALNAWVPDKHRPFDEILVEQKAMNPNDIKLLGPLVARHVERYGGDHQGSLAVLSPATDIRQELERIADPEVRASLAIVASARRESEDTFATRPRQSIGESTSKGLRFRILRPHEKGGLGQISVALDEELHREVALKEIQGHHADRPESRSRFVFEAEITGGLEHPGIVPVYGLGTYADGRPFYAMRFVRGDNLQRAINSFHAAKAGFDALEFRQLLGRFVDVCHAVAYAHSRHVLHRDLKPGNIMLGKYGETLVVDWGLAKLVDPEGSRSTSSAEEPPLIPRSASDTGETLGGSVIGTPEYMSPEQAAGRLDILGPAADVYSLGATLYELLSGQPSIPKASPEEKLRRVCRGDFQKPREVLSAIPRPLEAICLKAMSLHPVDRYASAMDVAKEIEQWLADEPVVAFAEPWTSRLRRWGRRHRALVTGIVALLGTAGLALAISTLFVNQARRRAEYRFAQARQAVDDYLLHVTDDESLQAPQFRALRNKLLNDGLKYYQDFLTERDSDQDLQLEYAAAHLRAGRIHHELMDFADAETEYQLALTMLERLPMSSRNRVSVPLQRADGYRQLADLYYDKRDRATAIETYGIALDALRSMAGDDDHVEVLQVAAGIHDRLSRYYKDERSPLALKHAKESLGLRSRIAGLTPDDGASERALANSHKNVATIYNENRKYDEAIHEYNAARRIWQDRRTKGDGDLALAHEAKILHELSVIQQLTSNISKAKQLLRQALAMKEDVLYRLASSELFEVAQSENDLGVALSHDMASYDESLFYLQAACDHRKRLSKSNPQNARYSLQLAGSRLCVGNFLAKHPDGGEDQDAAALRAYRLGLEALGVGADDGQNTVNFRLQRGQILRQISDLYKRRGLAESVSELPSVGQRSEQFEWVIPLLERAAEVLQRQVVEESRDKPTARMTLIETYKLLALLQRVQGRVGKVVELADVWQPLCLEDPVQLIDVAAELALCLPKVPPGGQQAAEQSEIRDRALEMIEHAVRLGFNNRQRLLSPDFTALQGNPVLQASLEEIQSAP